MKQSTDTTHGFTLLELLLYLGIVTVVLTALSNFAWNAIGNRTRSETQQTVSSAARLITARIARAIRNADSVNIGSSVFGSSPGTLSLTYPSPNNPTVITLSGYDVMFSEGGQPGIPLNSDDVDITSLIFTNYSTGNSVNIGFILTVTSSATSARREYQSEITVRSSAELKSN